MHCLIEPYCHVDVKDSCIKYPTGILIINKVIITFLKLPLLTLAILLQLIYICVFSYPLPPFFFLSFLLFFFLSLKPTGEGTFQSRFLLSKRPHHCRRSSPHHEHLLVVECWVFINLREWSWTDSKLHYSVIR